MRAAQGDERQLHHLHDQKVATELFEDAPHDELVHARREQEGDHGGGAARELKGRDARMIDVAQEEVVYRPVPVASELIPRDRVPPVGIEASIGEAGELSEEVELVCDMSAMMVAGNKE